MNVSMVRCSRLVIFFLQGKVFCCGTRWQVCRLRNANDVF